MKKFLLLSILVSLVIAGEFVPQKDIQEIARNFINQRYGAEYALKNIITYYGIDEQPNAYAYVFQNKELKYITIIMGARYTTSPIGEIYQSQPYCEKSYERALAHARKKLRAEPLFEHYYYFGAGEEYVGFKDGEKKILVNVHNLLIRTGDELTKCQPNSNLELLTRQKWDRYLKTYDFNILQGGYVDSVPFIDWVYGCSPTAASMIFWYWDYRGYGKLVDHFFTHWDNPENEWNECANTNRELALAMNTDTLTGGTTIGNIRPGMQTVANTYNGYSCSGATSPQGGSWNQYNFSWIKTEIDAQRPCHWNVLYYWYPPMSDYINHSITGVGYEITGSDTFVIVHTTWDNNEPLWPLWTYYNGVYSYDYVVTFIPGGSNSNNVFLDYPRGGDIYNIPIMFKNLKYTIKWHTEGSNIDHMKLWWSKGVNVDSYDSLRWNLIGNNIPNTGKFIWTCPTDNCSLRVNIAALDASNNRLAADGSFGRTRVVELNHSANVNIIGHYDTPGWANDVAIIGNYAYVADGPNGLMIIDISDSLLPDYVNQVALPGNSTCLATSSQYLYVGDREDTLRILSLANPTNPIQVGKLALSDDVLGLFLVSNILYVCARSQGLVIVDVQTPTNPVILGTCNTSGFAYDVVVDNNLAYVADATKGVRIIDISTPSNPVETGYYDTNGISYGVAKSGNYVYAADGTAGIKVFDGSSPDTLILLGSLDTPATASDVKYYNNHLFVADGSTGGVRIINVSIPSSPVEVGYILSMSTANSLTIANNGFIYLPDGNTGLLVIKQTIVGIKESDKKDINVFSLKILPQPVQADNPLHIQFFNNREMSGAIEVFDITGQKKDVIYQGNFGFGNNEYIWQPAGYASGIYFIRVRTDELNIVKKVLLVK